MPRMRRIFLLPLLGIAVLAIPPTGAPATTFTVTNTADDALTPVFYSRELTDRIPGAKLVVLDGGAHYAPVAAAEAWAAAVGPFLRAQPAG